MDPVEVTRGQSVSPTVCDMARRTLAESELEFRGSLDYLEAEIRVLGDRLQQQMRMLCEVANAEHRCVRRYASLRRQLRVLLDSTERNYRALDAQRAAVAALEGLLDAREGR